MEHAVLSSSHSNENNAMNLLAAGNTGSALGIMLAGLLIGGFAFFCAYRDFDWFMNNRRAALLVMILGRGGARIFYMLLGLVIIGGGLFIGAAGLFGY